MRRFLAATVLVLLGACNQAQPAADTSANPLNVSTLVGWVDVATEDINVPEGVSFVASDVGGARVMDISSVPENAATTQKTGGVSVRMTQDFESQVGGRQMLITVRAYSQQDGARLGVAYSTNEMGNSGWYTFDLSREPRDYHFVYNVPGGNGTGGDYLGMRSYGDAAVRVVGFRAEILPRRPGAAEPLQPAQN